MKAPRNDPPVALKLIYQMFANLLSWLVLERSVLLRAVHAD
jgi:hypothetical protein